GGPAWRLAPGSGRETPRPAGSRWCWAVSVVVAVLVGLAVLALAGPPPRHVGSGASRDPATCTADRRWRPGPSGGPSSTTHGTWGQRGRVRAGVHGDRPDLAGLLHAVAAQVRAGVPPGAAWTGVLGTAVDRQVPDV